MKFKKITAFAAAAMIAAGICTGVPTGTENSSPFAITAEAATEKKGKLDATVTYSGVSLDISWKAVKEADQYIVGIMYSTDKIPFASNGNYKSFTAKMIPASDDPSISIETRGLPLNINGKPYHYLITIDSVDKQGNTLFGVSNEDKYINYYFDSLDDLERTTYGNTSESTTTASGDAQTTVTGSQSYDSTLPQNYSATGGDKKIDVKWDSVSGAKSYAISYSNAGANSYKKAGDAASTSYTITGLTNGAAYDIMIHPSNSDDRVVLLENVLVGKSTSSKTTSSTSSSSSSSSKSGTLAAPTGFKASKTDTQITLSWGAVAGADGYRVYMYNAKTGKYEAYKSVASAKCTVSDLTKNTKYSFKVAALVKKDGKYVVQTASNAVSATTAGSSGTASSSSSSSGKLAAPTGYKASKTQTQITLSWSAAEGADGYIVYKYNEKTGKYEKYKSVAGEKCTVSDLTKGTAYKFRVAALVKQDGKYVVQTPSGVLSVTTKE